MELKTQVKALNYTKKLLTGDTASILSWPAYPQKPIFRQSGRTMVPLPRAVPEEMGVDSSRLEEFVKKLANIPAAQAHCVLVVRDGKLIMEGDFSPYTAKLWHVSHSLCKSVVGIAVGLLVDKQLLKLDTPLSEIFPEYFNLFTPRRTRSITVRHLLTMSSGINFREIGSLLEKDWLRSYFEADVLFEPGTQFDYNSMNTYVLGCIVAKLAQKSLTELLTEEVFGPLGFGPFEWEICPMGREKAGWGLYLLPEDMAKLGLLLLNDGVWKSTQGQEKRILSQQWVEQMTTTQMEGIQGTYGMQIWTLATGAFAMNGMFGQYVYCIPQNNTVIVLCSGSNNVFAQSPVLQLLQEYFASEQMPDTLPIQPEKNSHLEEVLQRLEFGKPLKELPVVQPQPWYKSLLQKFVSTPQEPQCNPMEQTILQQIENKTFYPEKNHVGILPLLVQCMQGNYTAGVDQMKFVSTEEGIKLLWTEGKETIEMPLHFSTPQSFGLAIGGEKWKMASVATATSNEDDVPVLKILLCFLEHTAVRRMKFFFYPEKTILRMEETPSLMESLFQMRGTPQADLILDIFKDAGYARYRFERFSGPEMELFLQPPENK